MTGTTPFCELRRRGVLYSVPSRSPVWGLALAVSSALVLGCRTAQLGAGPAPHPNSLTLKSEKTPSAAEPAEEDLTEAYAHYGTGVINEMSGEPELALEEYYQAALKNPEDESLVLAVSLRLLQGNRSDQALEVLTRATRRPDASGALYARLGALYSRLGKTDLAIEASRNAIKRDPRMLAGYRNLFLNYSRTDQSKKSLSLLDEAARVPGTDAEFLIGLAELYASFGLQVPAQKPTATARALALLQRAEKMNIPDPPLRLRLADGFLSLGEESAAAEIYRDLLKQLSQDAFWRENIRAKLVNIYLHENNPKLAAEQLEASIRDNPTDVEAYYWLGRIAYDEGQDARATEFFAKTLLLKPNFEPGYYELARAQISARQNRQALETLERAREKFAQNFVLEYLAAVACVGEKDYTNAWRYFNAAEVFALARDTNRLTGEFYFEFGAACERMGDYAQAEKYFEKCLQLSPDFSGALNYLGFMWADRGENLDRARALIERALKVEPQNAAYLDSMGWVLFRLHQPQQALDYMLQALRVSEKPDPTLYDHLGDIYENLGRKEQALEAWTKSLSLEPNDVIRKKIQSAEK
jgi:tetratricopeptide (TPR) repeat protein